MPVQLAIHGAAGRMGQRLVALASADKELKVVAALESAKHPRLGQDAGVVAGVGESGVKLESSLAVPVDVVIDFSVPTASESILKTCLEKKLALVVATTGFDARQKEMIQQAGKTIPLLWSPSMSLAVNLAMKLTGVAGTALKDQPNGV